MGEAHACSRLFVQVVDAFILLSIGASTGQVMKMTLPSGRKVAARSKIPGLDDDREAFVFQLPGDPLGPGAIGTGVADEEVFLSIGFHFMTLWLFFILSYFQGWW